MWGTTITFPPDTVAVDAMIFSGLNVLVHGTGLVMILLDEREIKFDDEKYELLYNYFYRKTGVSKLIFKDHIISNGKFEKFTKGDVITENDDSKKFYIIVSGIVDIDLTVYDSKKQFRLVSGQVFDIKYLNIFGIHVGLYTEQFKAVCTSENCLLYSFTLDELEKMAFKSLPIVASTWFSFILTIASEIAERPFQTTDDHLIKKYHTSEFIHKSFLKLEKDEISTEAGSGYFYREPCRNFLRALSNFKILCFSRGSRYTYSNPPSRRQIDDVKARLFDKVYMKTEHDLVESFMRKNYKTFVISEVGNGSMRSAEQEALIRQTKKDIENTIRAQKLYDETKPIIEENKKTLNQYDMQQVIEGQLDLV
jgi:hypothetical protein